MSGEAFLCPRLRGTRFESGGIPLEVLADLAALREMVLELARWRYMKANSRRRRAPRGFYNTDLQITGIESGSAIPVIKLVSTQPTLDGQMPYQKFFEEARDGIVEAIGSVERNSSAPLDEYLPKTHLAYFNRFGRSLHEGESLELSTHKHKTPVNLTCKTRNQLLRLSSVTELMREVTLRGAVPKADQDKMTFGLQQIYGPMVGGPMSEQHQETIIKAFDGYRDNTRVLVQGIGKYDRTNRLSSMGSIAHVGLLDPLDIPARLDEFRDIRDGWMDGEGIAPNPTQLDWLSGIFEHYYPDESILPRAYPTSEGGVVLEWSIDTWEISLEIDLNAHQGVWGCYDTRTKSDDEKTLDLDKSDSWKWIANQIQRLEPQK